MRQRTPLTSKIISYLPQPKLIVSTGPGSPAVDVEAAYRDGIEIKDTGYHWTGAPELTWHC